MNKDKQFYREFLRQAEGYVMYYPKCTKYICDFSMYNGYEMLKMFGGIVAKKVGSSLYVGQAIRTNYFILQSPDQRKEVMTELISYLKDKLNQLK